MAEYLASIFGTEKDKVNCSFYFKIGACRHGERCSRLHNMPTFSQTVVMTNMYLNPQNSAQTADGSHHRMSDVSTQEHFDDFFEEVFAEVEDKIQQFVFLIVFETLPYYIEYIPESTMTDVDAQQHYDDFFEEIFVECDEKYGEIEEMNVCDNLGDHLVGNVYVKFRYEEDAERCQNELNNRWFNGRPIHAELSPVTDFREACCRQYEMGECTRGGFCNFMHLRPISRELRRELYSRRKKSGTSSKRRSRSRSPPTRRSRSRERPDRRRRSPDNNRPNNNNNRERSGRY